MSVRTAVATRDAAVEQAAVEKTPAQRLKAAIHEQASQFSAVLPRTMDTERFSRLVLQACKQAPDLVRCFDTKQGASSMLLAATQCAVIGLEPNTPTQEAWLLPRRRSIKDPQTNQWVKVWECQLQIGYRGMLKLARRSGNILTIYAEVVHAKDQFHWARGLDRDVLEHVPADEEDRGEMTHAYAVARFTNGGYSFIVLSKHDIAKRRAMSDSYKGDIGKADDKQFSPWSKWAEAMWRKSAIRALAPYLDLTIEAATAVESDGRSFEWDADDDTIGVAPLELDGPAMSDAADTTTEQDAAA